MGTTTTWSVVRLIASPSIATTSPPANARVSSGVSAKAPRLRSVTTHTHSAAFPRASSTATEAACAAGVAARRMRPLVDAASSLKSVASASAVGGLSRTCAQIMMAAARLPVESTATKSESWRVSAVQSIITPRPSV